MGSKKKKMKKEVAIPKDWWAKCEGTWCPGNPCHHVQNSYPWCAEWSDKLTAAQMRKLNCGHPVPDKVDPNELMHAHYHCAVPHNRPWNNQTKACVKSGIFLRKLQHRYECQKPPERAANLDSDHSGKLAVGLSLGILLFLILLGVILYWYFGGRQKSDHPPKGANKGASKGASKGGAKTNKSKLGKSKLGSRKSSQRSSHKGSLRSKATKSTKKK